MRINTKLTVVAGVLLLATVVLVAVFQISREQLFPPGAEIQTPAGIHASEDSVLLPEATGDLGDAVSALNADLLGEQSSIAEEENDASIITSDAQEISDFGKAYQSDDF